MTTTLAFQRRRAIATKFRLAIAAAAFSVAVVEATATELDRDALKAIQEFAIAICKDVPVEGSNMSAQAQADVEARAKGLARQLANLGFGAAAKYSYERYSGIAQSDQLRQIQDTNACRLQIWNDLKSKLGPSPPPATTPKSAVTAAPPKISAVPTARETEEAKAREVYQRFLRNGDVAASASVASAYESGTEGLRRDDGQASVWYRRAADKGDARSQYKLGLFYQLGRGQLVRDDTAATSWFRKAADQGSADAMTALGAMYEFGRGELIPSTREAESLFKTAAQAGSSRALSLLGRLYAKGGGGIEQSDAKAIELLSKAVAANDAVGQLWLGRMYESGRGVMTDDRRALQLYQAAANQGLADAYAEIGRMHHDGLAGLPENPTEAVKWFQRAADQGSASGQYRLAFEYMGGHGGLTVNDQTAYLLLSRAASAGHSSAQDDLGDVFAGKKAPSSGVRVNLTEAAKWYQKSADQGNAFGQLDLAKAFMEGRGVEQSDSRALFWLKKAATQSGAGVEDWDRVGPAVPEAQFWLGFLYAKGRAPVVDGDAEAVKWFRMAAGHGSSGGLGQYWLAHMYETGRGGLNKSDAEAAKWYRAASDNGVAVATYNLAQLYLSGRGVEKNDKRAFDLLKQAADLGDTDAENHLGRMYDQGIATKPDLPMALSLYRKAALKDHPSGQNNLAVMYWEGRGVPADQREAYRLYFLAAARGIANAEYMLGLILFNGWAGQPKDPATGVEWMSKGAQHGSVEAQNELKRLNLKW